MPQVRRATMLVVVLVLLAGGIAAGAVADHRHKNARMGRADVASWYCHNRNQRCQEPQAETIEASWQQRERVYRVSFWVASLGAMTVLVLRLRGWQNAVMSRFAANRESVQRAVPMCGMRPRGRRSFHRCRELDVVGQRRGWACAVLPIVLPPEVRSPHDDDGRPARVSARPSPPGQRRPRRRPGETASPPRCTERGTGGRLARSGVPLLPIQVSEGESEVQRDGLARLHLHLPRRRSRPTARGRVYLGPAV